MGFLARLQDPEVTASFGEDLLVVSSGLSRGRQGFNTQSALRTKPGKYRDGYASSEAGSTAN